MNATAALSGLSPHAVWHHFARLSGIPRGSGKEQEAAAFVQGVGLALNLETRTDARGNVVIRKPATRGMEDRPAVALQCHLDMVQQQVEGRGFDFDTDPIELVVDGDWVTANGTTLGADNGIGVALALAVLTGTELAHPAIEAVFTVDEEVGMTGAEALTADQLSARYLINLDMESDHELTIGCAGAVDIVAEGLCDERPLDAGSCQFELRVDGGLGGHSGLDIHLGRMNAIATLAETLARLGQAVPLVLTFLEGGTVANVIPGSASARFAVAPQAVPMLQAALAALPELIVPHLAAEAGVRITCEPVTGAVTKGLDPVFQAALVEALRRLPTGVIAMSASVPGLVETSNNLSTARVAEGRMRIVCLARSCVEGHKPAVLRAVQDCLAPTGAAITCANDAPGWEPVPDSALLQVMSDACAAIHGQPPAVIAIHAGLETGILSNTFPGMQMVSYGPNIEGAHTPGERVQISSVQKVWAVLQRTLATIPQEEGTAE
ncbi:beta-Ala-His dipeptidase (plasmid) [Salipiger sp. H15]|uniref:Cytosol non-specific dipeptidase n=1 Tax=Alloyangia sp. H15 TaxID=3029062 RepID=A0AAU8ATT7_9RHOB